VAPKTRLPQDLRLHSPQGLGTDAVRFEWDNGKLGCVNARLEKVTGPPEPASAFMYAKTLVTPEEPVFVQAKVKEYDGELHKRLDALGEDGWSEADIQQLIDIGPPASSEQWGAALAYTEDRPDLAYEIHRRYRPMGYCSRDTRPITTQRNFAELCRDLSRPRCHLALMKDMLGYNVSRRSDMWIDGKPVSYTSQLDRLPSEVDAELLMLGLLTDFPNTAGSADASISPHFFALASHGSAVVDALQATLTAWIGDEQVDAYNRHRFAVALWFTKIYADQTITPAEHAASVAKLKGVPAATMAQLQDLD